MTRWEEDEFTANDLLLDRECGWPGARCILVSPLAHARLPGWMNGEPDTDAQVRPGSAGRAGGGL